MEYLAVFGLIIPAIIIFIIYLWLTKQCNCGKEDFDVPDWVVILISTCTSAIIVSFITFLVIG